ncbi:MAG: UDP-N-acetylmuramoyl-tripeptide--D-alanyl-D-alanine ligase [Lachnospiraceae bacterium]|nr:UDP-N-acetylmuramoyl-tripeptide--D-alanyl-D-alanine ligase [Lachnospiraceae bacterium]
MKGMTLENIAKACGGKLIGRIKNKDITTSIEANAIDIDSRKIGKNDVFVAIKGERADGHSFIKSVMEQGALCAIGEVEQEEYYGPYILVESTLKAMRDIAEYYVDVMETRVVGITGSVGKTSTKEMIASVLSVHFNVHKTAGNFNNEIGLPLTVFGIRDEHEIAILEMGISDFGEMHRLAQIDKPDIMVITNIGLCHLENLKSRDGILKAKTECLDHMDKDSVVVLNADDDKLVSFDGHPEIIRAYYSAEDSSRNIHAEDIDDKGLQGIDFTLVVDGESVSVHEPLPGMHNISNALAAAAVAHELGLTIEEIKQGIENASTIGGRSNFIKVKGITIIDDCYNANPVSMKASLDVLDKAEGRKIAVLGDMGELGDTEKELHYSVGEHCAGTSIDAVFTAGNLSKEIIKALKDHGSKAELKAFDTKEELIDYLNGYKKEGDTILVKASHSMNFNAIVKSLTD